MRRNTQAESRNINDRKLRNILSSKTFASTAAQEGRGTFVLPAEMYLCIFSSSVVLFLPLPLLSATATDIANYKLKTLNFALSRISPNEWQSKERHQDRTQCRRHTHTHTHTAYVSVCIYLKLANILYLSATVLPN